MAFMVGSTICATVTAACIRGISQTIHPFEIAFFASLFGSFVFIPLLVRRRSQILRTHRFGLLAVRGVLYVADILLLFLAFSLAPLAKVIALDFSSPLFAALLAVLFLGEKPRLSRILALVTGFAGTLVILRPGFVALDVGSICAFLAALIAGVAIIVLKILGRTESSPTITLYTFLVGTPLTLIAAVPVWKTPNAEEFLVLAVIAGFSSLIHLCNAQAFKEADLTAVLPINFLRIIWVSVVAYVFFAEVPDVWTWIGAVIIFGSAMVNALNERAASRARARSVAPPSGGLG